MRRKLVHLLLALAVVVASGAAMSRPAEARRSGFVSGIAIGTVLGLGIAGAAYAGPRYYGAGPGPGCYPGPRRCTWVGRSCWVNRYGETICSGGDWRCWRPTICD